MVGRLSEEVLRDNNHYPPSVSSLVDGRGGGNPPSWVTPHQGHREQCRRARWRPPAAPAPPRSFPARPPPAPGRLPGVTAAAAAAPVPPPRTTASASRASSSPAAPARGPSVHRLPRPCLAPAYPSTVVGTSVSASALTIT